MWTVLSKQYPNFEVLVHNQYFHGDYPVAVDLYDPGAYYLDQNRKYEWPRSPKPLNARIRIHGKDICAEALRQIFHWLKQNQYNHRIDYNKATVFLRADQIDDALKFLTDVQPLMNPGAIKIRAVDDGVGIGEKKVSAKFKKFQFQVILKPGWYTREEVEQWMHVVKTQEPDIYMTSGVRKTFHWCLNQNKAGCAVTSVYMFVKDQSTLTYLWLNFPTTIKKTFRLV